jgi:hypothetical protein
MAAPKPDGTFRVVHQIDPLNAISFTAMACMVGDAIEESRQRAEDRIACSYRIKLDRWRVDSFLRTTDRVLNWLQRHKS